MRFKDARAAGRALSAALEAYGRRERTVVLALARGGVGVGLAVAERLGLPLDIVFLRRLLAARGPAEHLCVVNVAGTRYLDEGLAAYTGGAASSVEGPARDSVLGDFIACALDEFDARVSACRGRRPPLELAGRTALLVDNGIRTGSTMRVAIRALRTLRPARVVAAVPVAATEGRAAVEALADEVVCLASPEPFGHVGLWYADFTRPGDGEIRAMLGASQEALGRTTTDEG